MNRFRFLLFFLLLPGCRSNEKNNEDDLLQHHLSGELVEHPDISGTDTFNRPMGLLSFADTLHDFGEIMEGEQVMHEFEFVNQGRKDILISEAKASCGCTVPEFPQAPVRPGEKGSIKVTFNSEGKKGFNEKLIIVRTNGHPSIYNLYIRAAVSP